MNLYDQGILLYLQGGGTLDTYKDRKGATRTAQAFTDGGGYVGADASDLISIGRGARYAFEAHFVFTGAETITLKFELQRYDAQNSNIFGFAPLHTTRYDASGTPAVAWEHAIVSAKGADIRFLTADASGGGLLKISAERVGGANGTKCIVGVTIW